MKNTILILFFYISLFCYFCITMLNFVRKITLKAPSKIAADDSFFSYFYLSKEKRFDV